MTEATPATPAMWRSEELRRSRVRSRISSLVTRGPEVGGSSVEVPLEWRGDTARALFYMATRYLNGDSGTSPLTLVNVIIYMFFFIFH